MARPAISKGDAAEDPRVTAAKVVRQRQKDARAMRDAFSSSDFATMTPAEKDQLLHALALHFGFVDS